MVIFLSCSTCYTDYNESSIMKTNSMASSIHEHGRYCSHWQLHHGCGEKRSNFALIERMCHRVIS